MKKISRILLAFYLIFVFGTTAMAVEKVVQLTVPGCRPCGAASRINAIMKKTEGVKKYENRGNDQLVITFDDKKITLDMIIGELNKGKFTVRGEPAYLK